MLMTDSDPYRDAARAVTHGQRPQPWRAIHKALRALMAHILQRVGALDASRADERAEMAAEVALLLQALAEHVAHENTHFHVALRQRAPRAVAPFDADHDDHLQDIAALRSLLQAVLDAGEAADASGDPSLAGQAAYALYLELSRFVAENLEHMAEEETLLTRALWQHFDDDEIAALEAALLAALPPEALAFAGQWMSRALNASERAALARG